jgi:hypothetical protein
MVSYLASQVAGLGPQRSGLENVGQNIQNLSMGNQQQQMNQQRMAAQDFNMQRAQVQAGREDKQAAEVDGIKQVQFINRLGKQLLNQNEAAWPQTLAPHLPALQAIGYDPQVLQSMTREQVQSVVDQTDSVIGEGVARMSADQEAFERNIQNFSDKDKERARKIRAKLEAPEGTLTAEEIGAREQAKIDARVQSAEKIGDSEAIISSRKKFGEMTASSRAKTIDEGFDKISNISSKINNIDEAIGALSNGASTGAIESRFFPSIRAATVELEQIQKEMALDVLGGVTLGSISEEELDLVQRVALPTGLSPEKLKEHLVKRKTAQQKLKNYFEEQIDFLDQGGTVAGFLRKKKREAPQDAPQAETQAAGGIKFLGFE